VIAIHDGAKGLPRTISVICDNALLSGFALERAPVDEEIVEEVCRDFDLLPAHQSDRRPATSDDTRPRTAAADNVRPFLSQPAAVAPAGARPWFSARVRESR
jgi:hypothetical protein